MSLRNPIRVVAAIDLDATARPTWNAAATLLANADVAVSLVHVIRASEREVRRDVSELSATVGERHERVQELLAAEIGAPSSVGQDRVEVYVAVGDPAAQIVQLAVDLEADLIIVGTHGRKGLDRLVLGSVSAEVFRRAPCSVLVARAPDYEGLDKTPAVEPAREEGTGPTTRPREVVRYRSSPFTTYNANLFPTGIPRKLVR